MSGKYKYIILYVDDVYKMLTISKYTPNPSTRCTVLMKVKARPDTIDYISKIQEKVYIIKRLFGCKSDSNLNQYLCSPISNPSISYSPIYSYGIPTIEDIYGTSYSFSY